MSHSAHTNSDFARLHTTSQQHMPALDGLRAIAILYVLWHNTTAGAYQGNVFLDFLNFIANSGWLGVQLFFVLSGFLITGILLDSAAAPRRFMIFYARRFLRIFPAYYTVLIIVCLITPLLISPEKIFHEYQQHNLWYWLFLNNWVTPFVGSAPILGHLWSLAVEEQFYIFWPACIFLLPRRAIPWLCVSAVITALITRFGLNLYDPDFAKVAAYQFTIARWDALAIGGVLACIARDPLLYQKLDNYWRPLVYSAVAYIILFCLFNRDFAPTGSGLTPLNQTVAALFFAALILYSIHGYQYPARLWQRFLMLPALQTIGKLSYAMYLFHLPVAHLIKPFWQQHLPMLATSYPSLSITLVSIAIFAVTYITAVISWKLIERPLLKMKRFFAYSSSADK